MRVRVRVSPGRRDVKVPLDILPPDGELVLEACRAAAQDGDLRLTGVITR